MKRIFAALFAVLLIAHFVCADEPIRERIEWADIWVTDADKNDLPRVLLVGDSITRGYFGEVEKRLVGKAYCARLTTSKCVSDPSFTDEVQLLLKQYKFAVIHFNNGLHGWGYTEQQYRDGLLRLMETFKERAAGAKLIWATTTPVRERDNVQQINERTKRVKARNQIAAEIMKERAVPTDDLYGLVESHAEFFSGDGVHYNGRGREAQAKQVAESVVQCLAGTVGTDHTSPISHEAGLPATAQDAQKRGNLDLDLNRLKTWGTKSYTYEASRPGRSEKAGEGQFMLKTIVGPDSIILDDTIALIYRGKELSLHLTHQCRKDNFLSPMRIESKGEGDDEFGTFVATIDGRKATIRSGSGVREIELLEGTVSSWAFFRLVTLLPREKGGRVSFDYWLESEEMHLKRDFVVECVGRETITQQDTQVACTKFRLTRGGNFPNFYWVDDEDVLRQVLIDEMKLIRLRDDSDKDE